MNRRFVGRLCCLVALFTFCTACVEQRSGRPAPSASESAEQALPPAIISFETSHSSVLVGDSVTVSWQTSRAERVELLVGPLDSAGSSVDVLPLEENLPLSGLRHVVMENQKTFELVVHGHNGQKTSSGPVTVYVAYPQIQGSPESKTLAEPGLALVREVDAKPLQSVRGIPVRPGVVSGPRLATLGSLAPPRMQKPRNGTVYSHYPRELQFSWVRVDGASGYGVEVDCYQCCAPRQWCRDAGRVYHSRSPLRMNAYSYTFPGAQRGRWRVWSIDWNGNAGPRSDWSVFRFTR